MVMFIFFLVKCVKVRVVKICRSLSDCEYYICEELNKKNINKDWFN